MIFLKEKLDNIQRQYTSATIPQYTNYLTFVPQVDK